MVEDDAPWKAPLDEKVGWCMWKIMEIKEQLEKQSIPKPNKPWYTSIGIWIALILFVIMIVMIYLFYLTEIGWTVSMPKGAK